MKRREKKRKKQRAKRKAMRVLDINQQSEEFILNRYSPQLLSDCMWPSQRGVRVQFKTVHCCDKENEFLRTHNPLNCDTIHY